MRSSAIPAAVLCGAFASALLVRLIPYLVSGVPYHTDTFGLLSDVNTLVSKSPTPLATSSGFDASIYWPASAVFGATVSEITGVAPFLLLPVLSPLIGATATLTFYSLLRELGMDALKSSVASLLLGLAGGSGVISAGVTKEGFAFPLMFLALALFVKGRSSKPSLALFAFAFVAVMLSHHLTAVVTLVIAAYLVVAEAAGGECSPRALASRALAVAGLSGFLAAYIVFYTAGALSLDFGIGDYMSVIAYQFAVLMPLAFVLASSRYRRRSMGLLIGALYVSILAGFAAALRYSLFLAAPVISVSILVLLTPYLVVGALAVAAVLTWRVEPRLTALVVWVAGMVAMEGFVVFGTPGLLAVAYRLTDFLYPAAAALAAVVLVKLVVSRGYLRVAGAAMIVALALGSAFAIPYTAFYSTTLGGSQRAYQPQDFAFARWTSASLPSAIGLSGDIRAEGLLGYYGKDVSVRSGLAYLEGNSTLQGCFVYSILTPRIGYIALDYGILLSQAQASVPFTQDNSVVFSDGSNALVCRS